MQHSIPAVFLITILLFSTSRGQDNLRKSKSCEACKPENCPIPRQCLAGSSSFLSLFVMFIAFYHRNSLFEYIIWFHISGYVPDRCGCCQICARLEHELCDISPEDNKYGICGENLECRSRNFDGGVYFKFRYLWYYHKYIDR